MLSRLRRGGGSGGWSDSTAVADAFMGIGSWSDSTVARGRPYDVADAMCSGAPMQSRAAASFPFCD